MTAAARRDAALGLARAAASRDLETEGIPVVLALTGADGPLARASDARTVADGARLAARAGSLREALWPDARADDLFVTYAVLATVGSAEIDSAAGR